MAYDTCVCTLTKRLYCYVLSRIPSRACIVRGKKKALTRPVSFSNHSTFTCAATIFFFPPTLFLFLNGPTDFSFISEGQPDVPVYDCNVWDYNALWCVWPWTPLVLLVHWGPHPLWNQTRRIVDEEWPNNCILIIMFSVCLIFFFSSSYLATAKTIVQL